MSKPTTNLRLFVAAYPPRETADVLVARMEALDLPPHAPMRPEQVHLTLQFIGDTPAAHLPEVLESVRRAAGGLGPFALTVGAFITIPEQGPARLIAASTDAPPTLLELQRRLAARLARSARVRPDDRFLPHMTLCRFHAPTPRWRLPDDLGRGTPGGTFPVARVLVMRSTLYPEGAEHTLLEAVELGAS